MVALASAKSHRSVTPSSVHDFMHFSDMSGTKTSDFAKPIVKPTSKRAPSSSRTLQMLHCQSLRSC